MKLVKINMHQEKLDPDQQKGERMESKAQSWKKDSILNNYWIKDNI